MKFSQVHAPTIRHVEPVLAPDTTLLSQSFSQSGPLVVGVSEREYAGRPVEITALILSLVTAGSGTTTVDLLVNGASVTSVALLATETFVRVAYVQALTADDHYQAELVMAGADAMKLNFQVLHRVTGT